MSFEQTFDTKAIMNYVVTNMTQLMKRLIKLPRSKLYMQYVMRMSYKTWRLGFLSPVKNLWFLSVLLTSLSESQQTTPVLL